MPADLAPFLHGVESAALEADGGLGAHLRRPRLAQEGLAHLEEPEVGQGESHARPASELRRAAHQLARLHARDGVLDVLLDVVGGLEAEEVKVAQQVVVEREELQVELGQREARVARVVEVGQLRGVPGHDLVRVERQRPDGLVLRLATLVAAHEHVQIGRAHV